MSDQYANRKKLFFFAFINHRFYSHFLKKKKRIKRKKRKKTEGFKKRYASIGKKSIEPKLNKLKVYPQSYPLFLKRITDSNKQWRFSPALCRESKLAANGRDSSCSTSVAADMKKGGNFSSWTSSRIKIELPTNDVVNRKLIRGPGKVLRTAFLSNFASRWKT